MVTYFYFQHFGISLNGLGWPYHAFYMYSLLPLTHVFKSLWPPAVLLVIVVFFGWLYLTFVKRRVLILLGALGAMLVWMYPLAWEAAQAEAQCVRHGGSKSIYLLLDPERLRTARLDSRATEELSALQSAMASNSATLLAETDNYYFVLFQPGLDVARDSKEFRRAPVFRVPVEWVVLARTTARALPSKANVPWGVSCDA
jgi:hypothetical protein